MAPVSIRPGYPNTAEKDDAGGQKTQKEGIRCLKEKLKLPDEVGIAKSSIARSLSQSGNKLPGVGDIMIAPLLMISRDALVDYLKELFGNATNQRCAPEEFESATVLPTPKSATQQTIAKTWRPIHLIPEVSKIFEQSALPSIVGGVEPNLPDAQFSYSSHRAYRRHLSTELALRRTHDAIRRTRFSTMINL